MEGRRITLLVLVLTLVLAYPLSVHPATTILPLGSDTNLFLWLLQWDVHALTHQPLSIFDANIYYPFRHTLAYLERHTREKGLRLGMIHGQMKTDEKQKVMTAFRDRAIDVLVATTVIEVGIDMPNATVMLIDNADRFGLSQLHQLRGRVGRGADRSYCLLISDAQTETAQARLHAMTKTSDGFQIAEMDLHLRGPGHFFGTRQHGLPEFKMADITSEIELLKVARADAIAILERDPRLMQSQHHNLRAALIKQFGETLRLAQVG